VDNGVGDGGLAFDRPLKISRATRLKEVFFRYESQNIDWIAKALRTIMSEHRDFRQITISVPCLSALLSIGEPPGEVICEQWLGLDGLLVQIWESRSIRPRVVCPSLEGEWNKTEIWMGFLLKEAMERRIIDLFECSRWPQ